MPIYKFGSNEKRGTQVYYELICDGGVLVRVIRHVVEWAPTCQSINRHIETLLPAPSDVVSHLSQYHGRLLSDCVIDIVNTLEGLADLRDFHNGVRFNLDVSSDIRYVKSVEEYSLQLFIWEQHNVSDYFYPADSQYCLTLVELCTPTGEWIGPRPIDLIFSTR